MAHFNFCLLVVGRGRCTEFVSLALILPLIRPVLKSKVLFVKSTFLLQSNGRTHIHTHWLPFLMMMSFYFVQRLDLMLGQRESTRHYGNVMIVMLLSKRRKIEITWRVLLLMLLMRPLLLQSIGLVLSASQEKGTRKLERFVEHSVLLTCCTVMDPMLLQLALMDSRINDDIRRP